MDHSIIKKNLLAVKISHMYKTAMIFEIDVNKKITVFIYQEWVKE